jgi:hypothetical protein
MNLSNIKKVFVYMIILSSITLLSFNVFTNLSDFDFKSFVQKCKYKITRTRISDFNSVETNIQNSNLMSVKIENIRKKDNFKILKNDILLDLLDLKYDLLKEVYILNELEKHLNKLNDLIEILDPRTKANIALYNTNKTLFNNQLICNEIDSGMLYFSGR